MTPGTARTTATLSLLGAVVLGAALQRTNGTLEPVALAMLTVVIALIVASMTRAFALPEWLSSNRAMGLIALAGLAHFIHIDVTTPPGMYLRSPDYQVHHAWIAVIAVVGAVALQEKPLTGWLTMPLIVCTYLALGLWMLQASPSPIIDVFTWHQVAYEAVAQGLNPYAQTMPNIYHHTLWYAAGAADNNSVFVGYVYPPMTLLLGALGHVMKHDYRYANLLMLAASGVLIARASPGVAGRAGALLFLFTPRGLFVLEQGWTESSAFFMLSLVLWSANRAPRALPYLFGAMLATKQYLVLLAPLMPFVMESRSWRDLGRFALKAGAVGAAVTLPFMVWNFEAFWRSVVAFQGIQPFRADALSYMAWWLKPDGTPVLPMWFSFFGAMGALVLAWWRTPRTPAGFALAAAAVFILFFGFAKQAFCNYYFLVVAILCLVPALAEADAEKALQTTL